MRREDEFREGEEAEYHEDGNVYRVKVLSNNSDSKSISYSFEVLEILREGRLTIPTEVGEKFEFFKCRNFHTSGLGHLLELS